MLDSKVMHKVKMYIKFSIIFVIFQCFLYKSANSEHIKLEVIIDGKENFSESKLIVEGYDKQLLFKGKNIPLTRQELSIKKIGKFIDIITFSHNYMGFFVYIDLNNDRKFNLDFKNDPIEPYGYSLNPKKEYKRVRYEDIVIDMNLIQEPLKIKISSINKF